MAEAGATRQWETGPVVTLGAVAGVAVLALTCGSASAATLAVRGHSRVGAHPLRDIPLSGLKTHHPIVRSGLPSHRPRRSLPAPALAPAGRGAATLGLGAALSGLGVAVLAGWGLASPAAASIIPPAAEVTPLTPFRLAAVPDDWLPSVAPDPSVFVGDSVPDPIQADPVPSSIAVVAGGDSPVPATVPAQQLVKPIFTTFNTLFLPPFALMILLPGWTGTKLVMRSPAVPTVIALLFLAELVAATQADYTAPDTGLFDTERWQAAARYLLTEAVADPALMREFAASTPSYIAQDWLHVCAWDVIGARWIYLDGLDKAVFTAHSVFLCQAAGPVGWLSHSLTVALADLVRHAKKRDAAE